MYDDPRDDPLAADYDPEQLRRVQEAFRAHAPTAPPVTAEEGRFRVAEARALLKRPEPAVDGREGEATAAPVRPDPEAAPVPSRPAPPPLFARPRPEPVEPAPPTWTAEDTARCAEHGRIRRYCEACRPF